jgi:hypothetical protein
MLDRQEIGSMFGLFKKTGVTTEATQSLAEAKDLNGANWRSILNQADACRDSYRAALVVLNVKLICEFAPCVRDRSEYKNFRHRAIDLAIYPGRGPSELRPQTGGEAFQCQARPVGRGQTQDTAKA